MDLSSTGLVHEVNGAEVGVYVRPPPPEYYRPVYFHSADTGAMSEGRVTAGGADVDEMVGSGQT